MLQVFTDVELKLRREEEVTQPCLIVRLIELEPCESYEEIQVVVQDRLFDLYEILPHLSRDNILLRDYQRYDACRCAQFQRLNRDLQSC